MHLIKQYLKKTTYPEGTKLYIIKMVMVILNILRTVRDVNYQEMQEEIEEFLTFHFLVMDLKSL